MIKSSILFPVFLLLSVIFTSFKAVGQIRCTVQRYTTAEGISHDRTTTIIKDAEGFLWVGTWDGMNRFDGSSFVSYKSYPGDRAGLNNDRIDQIKEDSTGNFWLKSVDEFYQFNKKTEIFQPVSNIIKEVAQRNIAVKKTVFFDDGSLWFVTANQGVFYMYDTRQSKYTWLNEKDRNAALPGDTVNFVFEDRKQRVWIGTSNGLASFKRVNGGKMLSRLTSVKNNLSYIDYSENEREICFSTRQGFLHIIDKNTGHNTLKKLPDTQLHAIRYSKNNRSIYCSTLGGHLVVTNRVTLESQVFNLCPDVPILSIYEDAGGKLWLEPKTKGVIRFDASNELSKWFDRNPESSNQGNFFKVLEDRWGKVWVSLKGGGFGFYDPASQNIVKSYQAGDGESYSFPQTIYAVHYDKNNLMWLGTNDGIVKVMLHGNSFNHLKLLPPSRGEMENDVRAILYDRRDRLWVGSRGGKFNVLQNGKPLNIVFENLPAAGFKSVYTFIEDRRGSIWIGTKFDGIYRADPLNESGTRYKLSHFTSSNSNLSYNDIFAMHEDRNGGIWIGTFGGGLNKVVSTNGKVDFLNAGNAFKKYPKAICEKIRHINSDAEGNIWLATTDGLLVFRPSENTRGIDFVRHSKMAGDESSLGDNDVQYVFKDNTNRMWLATSGGGICLVTGNPLRKVTFKSFLKKDGLPSDYALSMIQDKKGNLWIATQNGLSCYDFKTDTFTNYDEIDGLTKGEFAETSCASSKSGILAFGTTKGFSLFNPVNLSRFKTPHNIVLTNLQVNNSDVVVGAKDSILKENINYLKKLVLNYDQNIISIDFSNLDLKGGAREDIFYRLRGLSNDWTRDHTRRRATYTNLAPGKYTLEVAADIADPGNVKTLEITIKPPFWRTWWAYLIYILIAALLVRVGIKLARTFFRLRQNVEVERRMADLKVDFFTNVSHELRTPLTLILNPIEEIGKRETLSERGRQSIKVVQQNAGRIMRFMNQWLELRQIKHGNNSLKVTHVDIVALVKRVSEYFLELCREKDVEVEIVCDRKEAFLWLDNDKMDVVIYNLLSNALKFTKVGTAIQVKIDDSENELCSITVSDRGPGVPPDKLDRIFDLYYVDQDEPSGSTKGIGIGLAYSKELVRLHKGNVIAWNNEFGGLSVSVELPKGLAHLAASAEVAQVPEPSMESTEEILPAIELSKDSEVITTGQQAPLVLLVEDNPDLRTFLTGQLQEQFRVETAVDGRDGLLKAEELLPDLIVSDIMMPHMDGIEMLDRLKKNDLTSHIPIVLLTAKVSIESQIEALNYGADFYITKPFRNDYLLSAIKNLISKRERTFKAITDKRATVELNPSEIVITSKDKEFLERVVGFVEREMVEPEFNIDKVAEAIGMGRTTFYNKFKSLTNLSPVEFVRDMRLKRSKQYFDAGETNVSTVAYSCGFNNAKYFSTCFKEKYKISPKEYLKSFSTKLEAPEK